MFPNESEKITISGVTQFLSQGMGKYLRRKKKGKKDLDEKQNLFRLIKCILKYDSWRNASYFRKLFCAFCTLYIWKINLLYEWFSACVSTFKT